MSPRTRLSLLFAIIILPLVTGCQGLVDIGRAEARESVALLRDIVGVEVQAAPDSSSASVTSPGPSSSQRGPAQRGQRAPAIPEDLTPTPAPTDTPQPTDTSSPTVIVDVLNVRSGPGLNYEVVTQVQQGDRLTLLRNLGTWLQVRTPDGTVGYVMATYVSTGDSTAQAQPQPPRSPWSPQGRTPPGWNAPPGWGSAAPSPRRSDRFGGFPPATGPAVTDNAGNSVRVADATGGTYTFNAQELLRLLRDEGIQGQDVVVTLTQSGYGNRSETSFGRMLIDCNPINIPVDAQRPNPPGNGKTGAAFCNAVAMHETYHLMTLAREHWGGQEADADTFATQHLRQYSLVTSP